MAEEILPPWPRTSSGYTLGETIGIGSTATVYKAVCIDRTEPCAIKCINLEKCCTSLNELTQEIQAMSLCAHPNVVSFLASFIVKEELWIVMRLLGCGSMLDVLKRKTKMIGPEQAKNGVIDEVTIATILRDVLRAFEYFHSNGQVHRDIKAGNILLADDGTVQVGDFGVSGFLAAAGGDLTRDKVRHTFVGTPCWMAPEVADPTNGYDFKADIWSLGILAIELVTGHAPYSQFPPMKILMMILQNEPPTLEAVAEFKDQYKNYGSSFREFLKMCLKKDPTKRATASELLKTRFIRKAKEKKRLVQVLIDDLAHIPSVKHRIRVHSGQIVKDQSKKWKFKYDSDVSSEEESLDKEKENDITISVNDNFESNEDHRKMVLRIRRSTSNELHDVRFSFEPTDTPESLASEMVASEIVLPEDERLIAAGIREFQQLKGSRHVFPISSFKSATRPDREQLIGYASLHFQ